MRSYVLTRLLLAVPTILGVVLVVFIAVRTIPGDPAEVMLGTTGTREQIEALRQSLGLDQPIPVQLAITLRDYARGDLGRSIRTHRPVAQEIVSRYPYTLSLTLAGLLISVACGITFGMVAATRRGTFVDLGVLALSTAGIAAPVFWSGLLLSLLFAVKLGWFPTVGAGRPEDLVSQLRALALPAFSLGIGGMAFIARMTRSSVLEVLREDYIRTLRAKGLAEKDVLLRHALKNAAIPIVTVIGLYFGMFLGGAVIVETVFARPGLGKLLVDAMLSRDYPMIQGVVLVVALNFVVVNLLTDLVYGVLDPRIRRR